MVPVDPGQLLPASSRRLLAEAGSRSLDLLCRRLLLTNKHRNFVCEGGCLSTEVAFALCTQPFWVRFRIFSIKKFNVVEI